MSRFKAFKQEINAQLAFERWMHEQQREGLRKRRQEVFAAFDPVLDAYRLKRAEETLSPELRAQLDTLSLRLQEASDALCAFEEAERKAEELERLSLEALDDPAYLEQPRQQHEQEAFRRFREQEEEREEDMH
jgi:hypothetical protein